MNRFKRYDEVILEHVPRLLRGMFVPGSKVIWLAYDGRRKKYLVRNRLLGNHAGFTHWVPRAYVKAVQPPLLAKADPPAPKKYVLVLDVAKARYYDSETMARARIIELAKEAADRKAPQGVYAVCEVAREIVPCVTTSVELTERAPERK